MKILLLEDNKTDAELVIRSLKKTDPDIRVKHASNLSEARSILQNESDIKVALLDMQLPDGNGIDILLKIRQHKRNITVVMLTGSGDEEVAVAALKAGADDYMVKKADYIDHLIKTVNYAIERHNTMEQQRLDKIKVLHVEHNPADVDLTKRHLNKYAPNIVLYNFYSGELALEQLPAEKKGSETLKYDVILIDYRLPGINALEFIKIIRQIRQLDIPIIIVTGQGNEEVAVQALKLGASEYLMKRENYLYRLPSLILSAYQYIVLKRKQESLAQSEARYRLLAENSGDVIFTLDFDLNYTYISPAIYALRGYQPEEMINRNISATITPASGKKVKQLFEKYIPAIKSGNASSEQIIVELEVLNKEGTTIWVEIKLSVLTDSLGNPLGILGVSRDISKRKAVQDEFRKLSRAITQSPDSIVITDKDGNIEYVNPKFTQITGYNMDDVLGENPRILNSGEQPKSYYKELWDTILSGNDWYGEFRDKKKNGELYWESASISPLVNDDGEITNFVAVKEDITERKKMEQVQNILFTISIAVVTSKDLHDFINLIYSELTKVINTKNLFIALYDDSKDSFSTLFMFDTIDESIVDFPAKNTLSAYVLKKGKPEFIDKEILKSLIKSGEIEMLGPSPEVWIGVPIFENEKAIGVMVIQNYEGEKNLTREDLKILEFAAPSISLAIERKRFLEDLITEKENAQAADRLKTAFLTNMSHEIRTPMNAIMGFSSLLPEERDLENISKYAEIIVKNSEYLVHLIDDVMLYSKLQSNLMKSDVVKFELGELFNDILTVFKLEEEQKRIPLQTEIKIDLPFYINTDYDKLKQLLSNLLSNAFKHTKRGTIVLGVELVESNILFWVKDTGIGIPEDEADKVFERFYRADNAQNGSIGGTGLGLSIVKELAILLGGSIWFESKQNEGTTFYFLME